MAICWPALCFLDARPYPMTWLELSLTLRSDQQESVEAALEDVGALSVTLLDADAEVIGIGDRLDQLIGTVLIQQK